MQKKAIKKLSNKAKFAEALSKVGDTVKSAGGSAVNSSAYSSAARSIAQKRRKKIYGR